MQRLSISDSKTSDPIQHNLDAVTRRLARPAFLTNLTPSRLPSQAASDASHSNNSPTPSPRRLPLHHHHHLYSQSITQNQSQQQSQKILEEAKDTKHVVQHVHLLAPLIQLPLAHGAAPTIDPCVASHLQSHFLGARRVYGSMMAAERGFQTFAHGHQDLVLAVDFNYFGTRMVTASSDHRLKVWDKKDDSWSLVESWKAHDAEVVEVKWNGPFMGEVIGSVGEDGRCKLWQEDVTEVPLSGNRFKLITNMGSQSNAPFMSLDFKNIMQETWLALITRDGLLVVYEPTDQSSLNEWSMIHERWVCPDNPPERQEEVGFKVAFHKEKLPCWTAIMAGLDRKSIGLAVAAMNNVLIFRTDKAKRFYLVAELRGARQIIRDVAWANGAMRGHDVLATASKDGSIRIYELSTPRSDLTTSEPTSSTTTKDNITPALPKRTVKGTASGIGAGLAEASKDPEHAHDNEPHPGRIKQVVKMVDELKNQHGAVWRVAFSQMGDLLVSTGDDAAIRTWKKAVDGHWSEYAEIETAQET